MFFLIHTTYFQTASVQMAASAKGQLWSALKAATMPTYTCAAAPALRRCWLMLEARTEQKICMRHPRRNSSLAWALIQEVGIICLQQNNNKKTQQATQPVHTLPSLERQFCHVQDKRDAYKAGPASPSSSLDQRSHQVERGEGILQCFLSKL